MSSGYYQVTPGDRASSLNRPHHLRAFCKIYIGGTDVTDKFEPRLIQVVVIDTEGAIDVAHIDLDDRYGRLRMPTKHDSCKIYLGWPDEGQFITFQGMLSDIESSGQKRGGRRLRLEAKSMDLFGQGKAQSSGSWGDGDSEVPFERAAKGVAQKGGFQLEIHPEIAQKMRKYWNMTNESPMAWLERMAREVGGVFKMHGDKGSITKADGFENAQGQQMPAVMCEVGKNVLGWRIKPVAARPAWTKTGSQFFDQNAAGLVKKYGETTGFDSGWWEGASAAHVNPIAAGPDSAQQQGEADATWSGRRSGVGWIMIDGNPQAKAQGEAILKGAREGVDGSWKITEAEHTYVKGGGFTTRIDVNQTGSGQVPTTGQW